MSLREPAVTTPSSPTAPDRRIDFGRMSRRAWIITGMLVLFQIIAFADKAVLGLVSADAMPELGLTATEFGFIGSAFFFLYAIVSVVTGFLASKISVKWILFAMGVTWAVLQFPMLLGGGVVWAFASGAFGGSSPTTTPEPQPTPTVITQTQVVTPTVTTTTSRPQSRPQQPPSSAPGTVSFVEPPSSLAPAPNTPAPAPSPVVPTEAPQPTEAPNDPANPIDDFVNQLGGGA